MEPDLENNSPKGLWRCQFPMKRDWDKLRRQDHARPDYDPISSFHPPRKRVFKRKRVRSHKDRLTFKPAPKPPPKPDIERILIISGHTMSRWLRTKGKWKCIAADPNIDWFLRVNHPDKVESWLRSKHITFKWQPATPACAVHKKQAEKSPAEAYPPDQASVSSENNTGLSLNPKGDASRAPTAQATSPLEQDGDNPSPHCLIAADRTAEPVPR